MVLGKLIRTGVAALAALAIACVAQANAADISSGGGLKDVPAPPCCSFAGFYIGGNMGIAWSEIERSPGTFNDNLSVTNIPREKLNSTNGLGGGQFGYNFQSQCCWLYGIEVDLGALALNRNFHRFTPVNDPRVLGVELDGDNNNNALFAGDVTGRVGYTLGNSLIYAKGGFAFVDSGNGLSETIFLRNPAPVTSLTFGNNNNDDFLTGWTIGAGYEWKPCCQSAWSIKVEYLHYDLSINKDNCCNDFAATGVLTNRFRFDKDVTADTVKIGFNYFWNPAPAPLK